MTPKLPVSVLVVVHTPQGEVLLLERASRPGFWQSVTGSLDRPDEPLEQEPAALRRWPVAYTFEIFAQWRQRFAPGTTHNTEHLFSMELQQRVPVALAPEEHVASLWLPWRDAAAKCFSWSNRDAIRMLGPCVR